MTPKLDPLFRLYVLAAGLGWALFGVVSFSVAIGRQTPPDEAALVLLRVTAASGALLLAGAGACRGGLRVFLALLLGAGLAWALFLSVQALIYIDDADAALLALTILVVMYDAPLAFGLFLVLKRRPVFLLALERLVPHARRSPAA